MSAATENKNDNKIKTPDFSDLTQLSPDQLLAYQLLCVGKKNLMIQGCGGCGKSYLVRYVISWARKRLLTCYTTALTGMAAANLNNTDFAVCATTFHGWLGCGLANQSSTEMVKKIGIKGKLNIQSADILIIDEISMMSSELFQAAHEVCCAIRRSNKLFGGIQLICVGDLYQLPPVKGSLICTNPLFLTLQLVVLKTIFRQKDPKLLKLLGQVRDGELDDETLQSIKSLDRDLPGGIKPVILKPTRSGVDEINQANLDRLVCEANPLRMFSAEDGPNDWSDRVMNELCVAPKRVYMCKGCRVMLIRNINNTLHNGSLGEILSFDQGDGLPIVKFDNGIIAKVEPICWEIRNPTNKKMLAYRYQIPLILGYAMTIHKSQGQTIEYLDVDLEKVFKRGMTYVALSRCVSFDGLAVRNFAGVLLKPDPIILDYFTHKANPQVAPMSGTEPHA